MVTYSNPFEKEDSAFTRAAIWALLAGIEPDIDLASCGQWESEVRGLLDLLHAKGIRAVEQEYDTLMMNNLGLATVMANDQTTASGGTTAYTIPPIQLDTSTRAYLLNERDDDEGNARCLHKLYGHMFLYCDAYGYLYWNGKYWETENAEAMLQQAAIITLRKRQAVAAQAGRNQLARFCTASAKRVRDCITMLKSRISVSVGDFDKSPRLLNCANGVVDLANGQVTPHDPTQRFTYCLPVAYRPDADQTLWTDFLKDVVGGGPEVIDYLQRAVGYSLTGFISEECLFYVYGPTRSGKGTFSETLLALMPRPLAVEVDFTTFTATRDHDTQNFDLAPLKPARLIFASESNKYQTLNSAKIKSLTGGDEVRCAFKHRDHFEYKPQYKVWLLSNQSVNADVDDDAVWGRVRVINFPNSFLGQEDKSLKWRMRTEKTLEGVLAWAVAGAIRWHASQYGLIAPDSVKAETQKHRLDLDYVAQWLDECCQIHPTHFEPNHRIYQSYKDWCTDNGITPKQQRGLTLSLKGKGFLVNELRWMNGKAMRGVVGLHVL